MTKTFFNLKLYRICNHFSIRQDGVDEHFSHGNHAELHRDLQGEVALYWSWREWEEMVMGQNTDRKTQITEHRDLEDCLDVEGGLPVLWLVVCMLMISGGYLKDNLPPGC